MQEHRYLSPFEAKAFDETLALLLQAKHYENYSKPEDIEAHSPFDRLYVARESIRVTSRLGHVMAWLLYRKAIGAGELDEAETLRRQGSLDDEEITTDRRFHTCPAIPKGLRTLLEQSFSLYMRVARLDRNIRNQAHRYFKDQTVTG